MVEIITEGNIHVALTFAHHNPVHAFSSSGCVREFIQVSNALVKIPGPGIVLYDNPPNAERSGALWVFVPLRSPCALVL